MPVDVIMPKVDMDMDFGTLATWHKSEGDAVQKGDALFDIVTDKAAMEIESPASGTLQFVKIKSGDKVPIGSIIAWVFAEGEVIEEPSEIGGNSAHLVNNNQGQAEDLERSFSRKNSIYAGGKIPATPAARMLARNRDIDISTVSGTGPGGRVQKSDVEQVVEAGPGVIPAGQVMGSPDTPSATDMKARLDWLGISFAASPADRMRASIARNLSISKATIPHFYVQTTVRLDSALAYRKALNASRKETALKVSLNDIILRASALSLRAVPDTNVCFAGDEIIRFHDANISLAVALDHGLATPVLRQLQEKSVEAISKETRDVIERARSAKLAPYEQQGGVLTVSNLGMYGVSSFNGIIDRHQSMILAIGAAERRFIPDENDQPIAATLCTVSLSCDHRVVDGALAARWLAEFRRRMENPDLLAH